MRFLNLAAIVVCVLVMAIFAVQNCQNVTVHFFTFKMSAPHALLITIVSIFGMVTGGRVAALMRRALEGSRSFYERRASGDRTHQEISSMMTTRTAPGAVTKRNLRPLFPNWHNGFRVSGNSAGPI
jgi:uncharacterized integral membrane protein